MLCRELIEKLEELAPKSLACDWDNPGFLAGRGDKEIKKVLVALDATGWWSRQGGSRQIFC